MTGGLKLQVLYADDDLVAIDKPAWAVVHRTRGAAGAPVLVDLLARQLGAKVYPVHRLDRQTSGVMVFARRREVAAVLGDQLRRSLWRKRYLGLCRGVIDEALIVDHPVPEGHKRRSAWTRFEPVEVFCNRYTLVVGMPATGRRHQLRYHLKHAGHPLVGDVNYGQGPINRFFRETFALGRLFLHAERLELFAADGCRAIVIEAPFPADLAAVLAALREHRGVVP